MKKTIMSAMALILIEHQKTKMRENGISYPLLDSYVYHSEFKKEDFLKFFKNEELKKKKKHQIALRIVRYQIGRRGILSTDPEWWNYFSTFFCKFDKKNLFLGYKKEKWINFFIEVSKIK